MNPSAAKCLLNRGFLLFCMLLNRGFTVIQIEKITKKLGRGTFDTLETWTIYNFSCFQATEGSILMGGVQFEMGFYCFNIRF